MPAGEGTERPLRRDAERNRELLLAAASDVFAERGLDATMHDIAAHAGVGVGTAYRRFANKQQIIEALFEQRLDRVAALAQAALADPDAWHGFTSYLEQVLQLQQQDRGLTDIINHPSLGPDRANQARDRITPLLDAIVERAQDQGTLRPDFVTSDIVLLQYALEAVIDRARDIEPTLYRRYLTMFLDGNRADRRPLTTLPVSALNADATQNVMAANATASPTDRTATS